MQENSNPNLTEIKSRISDAKKKHQQSPLDDANNAGTQGAGYGLRLGLEMASALVVGVAIGYFIDELYKTQPLFMLIFGALGIGAGINNIYRVVMDKGQQIGYAENLASINKKTSNPDDDDDDDAKKS